MHRSGTSLVASVLQKAGLHIGRDVDWPGPGNPRGHFEDQDFFWLHEDMLAAAGESPFTAGDDPAPAASAEFERRARALVAARDALPLWGWKEPRTCLFLDFWEPILPQARHLFLYRHPVDVALSLWRRNTDPELRKDPTLAVRAWEVYNRRLLAFRDRHAERVFLAQVPALTADFAELVRRLRVKFGLPLHDGSVGSVFVPAELTPPMPANPAWGELIPGALALYRRLEENADLPSREAPALTSEPPARELELVRASETLLWMLHEKAGLLAGERQRRADLQAELAEELGSERSRASEAEARCAAFAQVLADIESSRSFTPVRAWWWLRRRFNQARGDGAPQNRLSRQ